MTESNLTIRDISDTARWVAYFRALETQRPDALFRDPYAECLAGNHGFQIANTLADGNKHEWAWVARTYLFNQSVAREIGEGGDLAKGRSGRCAIDQPQRNRSDNNHHCKQ